MRTQERFKTLLDIACDNGYKHHKLAIDLDKDLNNLVLNTNFFECLFKNSGWADSRLTTNQNNITVKKEPETKLYEVYFPVTEWVQYYKFQWVVEKDNALEWLFKQFNV